MADGTGGTKPSPTKRLYYLVDYDNLRRFATGKSLLALVQHLIYQTPASILAGHSNLEIRLYGGWRQASTSTVLAQTLATEIAGASFPVPIKLSSGHPASKLYMLNVTLAYASLCLPSTAIVDTYARGRAPRRLYTDGRPWLTCAANGGCHLQVLEDFLASGICPYGKCMAEPRDVFKQDEQKQVDTLIVADMAYLAFLKGTTDVVVVTSDTDIWPGVLLCLFRGLRVLQIHTSPGGVTASGHLSTLSVLRGNYSMASV
jgi:hypothetical protein